MTAAAIPSPSAVQCACEAASKQHGAPQRPPQLVEVKLPSQHNHFSFLPFDLPPSWYTTLHHLYFLP